MTPKFRDIPFLHANQIEMLQLTYCILLVLQLILQNFFTQETEILGFVFNFVAKKIKLTGCKNIRKISKILKLLYEEKKKTENLRISICHRIISHYLPSSSI